MRIRCATAGCLPAVGFSDRRARGTAIGRREPSRLALARRRARQGGGRTCSDTRFGRSGSVDLGLVFAAEGCDEQAENGNSVHGVRG